MTLILTPTQTTTRGLAWALEMGCWMPREGVLCCTQPPDVRLK